MRRTGSTAGQDDQPAPPGSERTMLDRPAEAIQAPPEGRQDRREARSLAEREDPAVLNGAAILAILRRHKLALFAPMLLVPLLAYVAISQITPRYTATGTLLYDAAEYKVREL